MECACHFDCGRVAEFVARSCQHSLGSDSLQAVLIDFSVWRRVSEAEDRSVRDRCFAGSLIVQQQNLFDTHIGGA